MLSLLVRIFLRCWSVAGRLRQDGREREKQNTPNVSAASDKKVAQTVICIIEEFFRQNPDILLYMCSTADGQQAQRARLFLRWFNGAEQQKHYVIRTTEVKGIGPDNKPRKEYVAFIMQRSNPHVDEIIQLFDADVAMFNEMKP